MNVTIDDLNSIVAEIWTSMLGLEIETCDGPVEANGERVVAASVSITGIEFEGAPTTAST